MVTGTYWTYPVELRHKEGEWHAYCPVMPEAIAAGETEHEALEEMREALAVAVRGRIKDEMELKRPPSGKYRDEEFYRVALPALLAAKASIYVAWSDSGMSKNALAGRLGIDEKAVRRLLDPDHPTRLDLYDKTLHELGQRMVIGMVEAAG